MVAPPLGDLYMLSLTYFDREISIFPKKSVVFLCYSPRKMWFFFVIPQEKCTFAT